MNNNIKLLLLINFFFLVGDVFSQTSLSEANFQYQKKNFKTALNITSKLILSDSLNTKAYFLRHEIYRCLGLYEKAFHDLNKYIELVKNDAAAYLEMARLREELAYSKCPQGFLYASTEDIDKETYLNQINDVDMALSIDSMDAEIYSFKAGIFTMICTNPELKNYFSFDSLYKEALKLNTKSIQLKPGSGILYYYRANTLLSLGDTMKACLDYKTGIRFNDKCSIEALKSLCEEIKNPELYKECCIIDTNK